MNIIDMLDPKRVQRGLYWSRAWSIVEGCTPVSPACKNCWSAEATAMRVCQGNLKIRARYADLVVPGSKPPKFNGLIRPMWDDLSKPTPRQKPAVWSVWNDLFHKDVPWNFIYKAFERMKFCRQHFFIVCTKRPERMAAIMPDIWLHIERNFYSQHNSQSLTPLKNVMAMTTAENQEQADKRILHLLNADFAYRGLSAEPMLEPLNLSRLLKWPLCKSWDPINGDPEVIGKFQWNKQALVGIGWKGLDWVIAGPETGPGARECKPEWIEDLYEQCKAAGVPFFDKTKSDVRPWKGWLARGFPK